MSLYTNFHITVYDSLYQVHNQSVSMYEIIPCITVLHKLRVNQIVQKFKVLYEPKISVSRLHKSATGPCLEPNESISHLQITFPEFFSPIYA